MLIAGSAPIVFPAIHRGSHCPQEATVVGVFGQSNSMSWPANVFAGSPDVFEYDLSSGTCVSSLSKVSSIRGNTVYGAVIDLKRRRALSGPVVVASWGENGTSVLQWGSGSLAYKTRDALHSLARDVGEPSIIFYHQGERDAVMANRHTGMSGPIYKENLNAIIQSIHNLSPSSNIGIAQATICGFDGYSAAIRQAQVAMARRDSTTFLSGDSDSLTDRVDGCHLTHAAMRQLAVLYADSYQRFCQRQLRQCSKKVASLPSGKQASWRNSIAPVNYARSVPAILRSINGSPVTPDRYSL